MISRKPAMLLATLLASLVVGAAPAAIADEINGSGSTFAYPIITKWSEAYKAKAGTVVGYKGIGSGGGIKQIKTKATDFGVTDMPLSAKELAAAGLTQFPLIMGGIVPVINLKGVDAGKLKLTGAVLADIYLGKITKWNDKAIADLNKDVALPDLAITPAYRSDGSGTTFNFTCYLAEMSAEWKDKVGANTVVEFPAGVGGKGNDGVAALTAKTDGSIGYVEYSYAKQYKMAYAVLANKEGQYVEPNAKSFQAAAANADWAHAPGFVVILANQPGKDSWPITATTFALVYKTQEKPEVGHEVLRFFDFGYRDGAPMALDLDYVPMPGNVIDQIEAAWKQLASADGKPIQP